MKLSGAILLFVVACAGEEPEPAPYVSAATYCERTVESFCDFYLRCDWMAVNDVETCRERFLETCNGRYEPLYVAVETAGLLRLTSAGLAACARHLDSVACAEQASELQGPCASMWEGQQPAGGACGIGSAGIENMVCAPGARCVLDLSFCGTCEATAPLGGDCSVGSDCEVTAACVNDRCVARAGVGASCADVECVTEARCEQELCVPRHEKGGVGEPCATVLDCQYTLACVEQECVAAAPLGATCDAGTPCDGGFCDGVCVPATLPGAACDADIECISGACDTVCPAVPGACF
jgi:hypothetical protein